MALGPITRSDILIAFSRATDLAIGQPMGFALQSAALADRLARVLHLNESERQAAFQQGLLRYIGCNSQSHEMAALLGDEIAFRRDFALIDGASAGEVIPLVLKHLRKAHEGQGPVVALANVLRGLIRSKPVSAAILSGHCDVAQKLGARLGLEPQICAGLGQLYARWDGKGIPAGLKGEEISIAVRLVTLAQDAMVLNEAFGRDGTVARLRERSGHAYDPKMVVTLLENWDKVMGDGAASTMPNLGNEEPLSAEGRQEAFLALADCIDIKSPYSLGHSRALSALAAEAGRKAKLPEASVELLRLAGLAHDIGVSGVPARLLDKPGGFSAADWEAMRLHTYNSGRIFALADGLQVLRDVISQHHERNDGSGYHGGMRAAALSVEARILAAAEAYQNMIEPRPHRQPLSPEAAARALNKAVRVGQLDATAVDAVLAAAGQQQSTRRTSRNALTPREVEVLQCLCRGQSMKEAARTLKVSPKTVDSHIQSIYAKTGVRTRGGAILYAVEHGLAGIGNSPDARGGGTV